MDSNNQENAIKEDVIRKNSINDFSTQCNIIKLQKDYEKGIIKEELSNKEKEELIKLYKTQIRTLENNITVKENELSKYKEKILKVKEIYEERKQKLV